MKGRFLFAITFVMLLVSAAWGAEVPKPATEVTKKANEEVLNRLPFSDRQDYEDTQRGFIATLEIPTIKDANGKTVWELGPFDFLKEDKVPDTVNPSLWRIAQLNMRNGLFKVTDGIYQVRGLDISNMTIIETDSKLILIDPLISAETAKAGLELYYKHVPQPGGNRRKVAAVIYSHSHVDHFGGVRGVVSGADVGNGRDKVRILAPDGFLEEAVSENVYAGNAMNRRAGYMYGTFLPKSPQGNVDAGLGKTTSTGTITLIPPTDIIKKTGEKRKIDGIEIEFQMAPDTEAPAEMLMYFPKFKALCAAEDATHTLHNLYTIRGAKVRDANKWWKALDLALQIFGDRTDLVFAQHHWPRWGRENVKAFLSNQRDGYKYLHDQTLYLANQGYTPLEIAETIDFPKAIAQQWYMRGYYGTVSHNVKAIYQMYLGWYDANPANLNPLPPEEVAKHYVAFMGGADAVLAKARESFARGEYRWVSEVMKHVVFADPENRAARELLADSLEQQGYQTESGSWRPAFLMGAYELRNGTTPPLPPSGSIDVLRAMTPEMLLEFLGVRLNAKRAEDKKMVVVWNLPETKDSYAIRLENAALLYRKGEKVDSPDATLTMPKNDFVALAFGQSDIETLSKKSGVAIDKPEKLQELLGLFDDFKRNFNIVTP